MIPGYSVFRLFGGTAAFKLLRWPDEPRTGESVQRFHGAEDALRFLDRLRNDPWSRRGVEDAARRATHAARTDDTGEVLRRFAGLLATGRAHLVRLPDPETQRVVALASATGTAAAPHAATASRPRFQLCDIPGAMDRLRWPVSARLMRRWFQGNAYPIRDAVRNGEVDPRKLLPAIIDESTVTMDWALGFARVASTRWELLAGDVGVYIRDAYEFTDRGDGGSQRLGTWSYEGVSFWPADGTIGIDRAYGAALSAEFGQEREGTTYAVRNEHFDAYRGRHRKGGDFILFSDVRRSRLPEPVVIDIGI